LIKGNKRNQLSHICTRINLIIFIWIVLEYHWSILIKKSKQKF